jgi:hypothetical protein
VSGSDYVVGDAVSDTGNYYVCIVAVINSTTSPPNDTTHFNLVAAQGAQGAQGATGPQGNAGPQGNIGSQGVTGAQGNQGFQGALGPQGNIGPQGYVGAQGAIGPQGYMGSQGPVGSQGAAGPQGTAGVQGALGPQGIAGPQGSIGEGGAIVYNNGSHQSISTSTQTILDFPGEAFDTNNMHSTSVNNSRFTIPAGVTAVRITAQVVFAANATGQRLVIFLKNGGESFPGNVYFDGPAAIDGYKTIANLSTPVLQVVAGDYFQIEVFQSSGGPLLVVAGSTQTWFAIEA